MVSARNDVTQELHARLATIDGGMRFSDASSLGELVHWSGVRQLALHRWLRYREGFSPELPSALGIDGILLDPFAGAGSILLGAAQRGLESTGIELNPLAVFAMQVKLDPLSARGLSQVRSFLAELTGRPLARTSWPVPAFKLAEKVFEPDILLELCNLRALCEDVSTTSRVRDFLLLAWINILELVGSYFKEGNGIKYRRKLRRPGKYAEREDGVWQRERFGDDQRQFVVDRFAEQLETMIADSAAWRSGNWREQEVIEGDARAILPRLDREYDGIVFSPPYANRFDYFESQKVELWFGGFVGSQSELLALRKRSVRSHLSADLSTAGLPDPDLESFIELIDPDSYAARARVPQLLRGYFEDMRGILRECRRLCPSGSVNVVIGNSAYGGVIVPTDSLIARIGMEEGFSCVQIGVVRSLTVAPQQRTRLAGFEEYMRESVVKFS